MLPKNWLLHLREKYGRLWKDVAYLDELDG